MTFDPNRFSRRDFLRTGAAGAALLGTGSLIAACGSSGSSAPSSTSPATTTTIQTPKRGGTLRVGLTGGTSADTLDPLFVLSNLDFARADALYDGLVGFDSQARPTLALASELTPNGDASVWTVRLRPGVTFHNGKPLTADDVIYTFQQMLNPKALGYGSAALTTLDVKNMKKVDTLTVQLPFTKPFSTLPAVLASYYYLIIPVGFESPSSSRDGRLQLQELHGRRTEHVRTKRQLLDKGPSPFRRARADRYCRRDHSGQCAHGRQHRLRRHRLSDLDPVVERSGCRGGHLPWRWLHPVRHELQRSSFSPTRRCARHSDSSWTATR